MLLVSAYYPNHGGGIEIVAHQIARRLADCGFDITWCAADCDPAPNDIPGLTCCSLPGSNFIENIARIPFPLPGPAAIPRLWKQTRSSDVIHLHDFIYPSNCIVWLFARIQKKPVIITQHIGLVPYRNPLFRLLFAMINRTVGRIMLNRSSQVVFIADHVRDYFARICRSSPPHWAYIPNGVDTGIFSASTSPAQSRADVLRHLPAGQFVLFVGRFVEKKGLRLLKDLVRGCDDIQWVFVGRGPMNPKLWGQGNVTTIEHMDHEDLAVLYRRTSLVVLPSVGEGFPLVIQEAAASGAPVLTTHETSSGCKGAQSFLFSLDIHGSDAVDRWEREIRDLLRDNARLEAASAAGIRYAEENWNWGAICKQYEKVFRQVVSGL